MKIHSFYNLKTFEVACGYAIEKSIISRASRRDAAIFTIRTRRLPMKYLCRCLQSEMFGVIVFKRSRALGSFMTTITGYDHGCHTSRLEDEFVSWLNGIQLDVKRGFV